MRATDLTDKVTILTISRAANGAETTSTLATVFANVRPLAGSEGIALDQAAARQAYLVTVPYRTGLSTTGHRLLWASPLGDKTLGITSLEDSDGRRRFLALSCQERA